MQIKDKYLWAAIALGGYAFWMYSKKAKSTAVAEEKAPKSSAVTVSPKPTPQEIVFPEFGIPVVKIVKSENFW